MNRITPLPSQMAGFLAYNTPVASLQGGDGTFFYAALGSIGSDKSTFHVYVWTEKPGGILTPVPITDPPNNAPSFVVKNGALVLLGALGQTIVERDVPGYVASVAVAGPRGAIGPTGPQGPPGPQGPAAAPDPRVKGVLDAGTMFIKALLGMK